MAEELRRGDVVTAVAPRAYGKPRPALIVQTDLLNPTHASYVICPFTTDRIGAPEFRLEFPPSAENGLRDASQLMVDKITTVPREKVGAVIGRLSRSDLARVNETLAVVLGLADRPPLHRPLRKARSRQRP